MILKYFDLKKEKIINKKFFLLYGNNNGLIKETINLNLKPLLSKNVYNYEEEEILKNEENFKENLLTKSFFENDKLIIISRISDKILKIIEEIIDYNMDNLSFILISSALDKKSKVRKFFEKEKNTICVAFYEDNFQTLSLITQKFFQDKKISISSQNINLIVGRASGDRINLNNELNKIELFCKNKKTISSEEILKLTNLAEDFSVSELVDSSLTKNKRKTLNILNENNFVNEDCILILRIFLIKLKRLLKLHNKIKIEKNVESAISNFRPPIFWKEKNTIIEQIKIWNNKDIQDLIIRVSNIEFLIKKNPASSIKVTTDFILEQTLSINN
tara:strand:- start:2316 stop:3311 length:996 start_codon:yes stop_codon:yes gene_type:complete